MPKIVLLILVMCLLISVLNAQDKNHSIIFKEIETELKLKNKPTSLSPFIWLKNNGISNFLRIDNQQFFQKTSDELIELNIPLSQDRSITVILKKQNVLTNDLKWSKIKTYRGVIADDPQSWVTINISRDNVNGIIADRYNNRVIETSSDGTIEIYTSTDKVQEEWECDAVSQILTDDHNKHHNSHLKANAGDTVTVYIECDYAMYQYHGSDVSTTINYVNSIMNDVAALYQNEQITLLVNDIHVWTTVDPYDKEDIRTALYNYQSRLNETFDADLAMLLSYNSDQSGGVAYVNSICQKDRAYSYSNLRSSLQATSTYAWQIHVIAHELGHNLGSPHTHSCEWGPSGDQALDNCYSTTCDVSSDGQRGTIMSYCHLSGQGGVNFSLGFGDEPGDRIRQTINECRNSDGTSCDDAMPIYLSSKDTVLTAPSRLLGNGASQANADRANWFKFTPHTTGHISISSCQQGVDTRLFVWSGTCTDLTLVQSADDVCDMGSGLNYAASIDTIPVDGGTTYYIEWDDRWSAQSFDFIFRYDFIQLPVDPCSNGIRDEGEEDVDCGGTACIPCSACELPEENAQEGNGLLRMRKNSAVIYEGHVSTTQELTISSGQSITFEASFEIEKGGLLDALIESCSEFFDRINDDSDQ